MSQSRLVFFAVLGLLCCVWLSQVLIGQYLQLEYRGLMIAIRSGKKVNAKVTAQAIADYQRILYVAPCNMRLHEDVALLIAKATDDATEAGDIDAEDAALEQMQQALTARLSCTPEDGKAWLDWAVINTQREGFTAQSQAAYTMSAQVAPRESWLAEKRLLFALSFRALFDNNALRVARADIKTLEDAHPNRMKLIKRTAEVESEKDLYNLFADAAE